MANERRNLLSSQARIQVPFVAVTIGDYKFGIYNGKEDKNKKYSDGVYKTTTLQYPNYVQSLQITKINGQINQYTLQIAYPVTQFDDPNFFEKIFSSVSKTRKIVFSYGDWSMPSYIFKDEEAIITDIKSSFNFGNSGSVSAVINYSILAVSAAQLNRGSNYTFLGKKAKPSDLIKELIKNPKYGLQDIFTGMTTEIKDNKGRTVRKNVIAGINDLIAGDDMEVDLDDKINISALDYLSYLVSCMIPEGTPKNSISKDIYILTLHDETTYDTAYYDRETAGGKEIVGAYFKVTRQSYDKDQADAYEIDIGYNTANIVSNFSISNQQNYSIIYDYQAELDTEQYVRRLNDKGEWEDVFAPSISSKNKDYKTRAEDITWWTKITQYPVNAIITVQGLLRPAILMQYVRLNVIFPGGNKHISSGLYIITKQFDEISGAGYKTTLSLTKIKEDKSMVIGENYDY